MSDRMRKLIKPGIAVIVIVAVLIIAYLSGSNVSVEDKPVKSDSITTTSVTTLTFTSAETTTILSTASSSPVSATASAKTTTAKGTAVTQINSTTKAVTASTSATQPAQTETTAAETAAAEPQTVMTEPIKEDLSSEEEQDFGSCTIMISCATIFAPDVKIDRFILEEQPSDGIVLSRRNISLSGNDSVYDLLKRVCEENTIPIETSKIAATNNYYIEGINNLYEFDAGNLSGWMYSVNGHFPQMSTSQYTVSPGDEIEILYSCNSGVDVGDDFYNKAG